MSLIENQTREALLTTAASLQQLISHVETHPDVDPAVGKRIAGGLRSFARILKRPPDGIPLRTRDLRKNLDALNAASAGVSAARFAAIRSAVGRALKIAETGALTRKRNVSAALSPSWRDLLDRVDGWKRMSLGQFCRFADAHGIAPDGVDARLLAAWADWRSTSGQVSARNPNRAVRQAATTWNHCRRTIPGWPDIELPTGARRVRRTPRMEDMPRSFQDEFLHFSVRFGPFAGSDDAPAGLVRSYVDHLLDEDAESERLAATTLKRMRDVVLLAAGAMVDHGACRLSEITTLLSVANPRSAAMIAQVVEQRRGQRRSEYLTSVVKALRSIACRQSGGDDGQAARWKKLLAMLRKDTPSRGGLTDRNRERILELLTPQNIGVLSEFPRRLMKQIEAERRARRTTPTPVTVEMALDAYVAVAVAILLSLPLRRANLVRLRLDKHIRLPVGREREGRMLIPEEEVKNDRPLMAVLKAPLVEMIQTYRDRYRPVLGAAAARSPYLLPAPKGTGHRSLGNVATLIRNRVHRHTGLRLNLHLYRHLMACLFLKDDPAQSAAVSALLGHAPGSIATTRYAEIDSLWAAEHADRILDGFRAAVAPNNRRC
jgi:integrase